MQCCVMGGHAAHVPRTGTSNVQSFKFIDACIGERKSRTVGAQKEGHGEQSQAAKLSARCTGEAESDDVGKLRRATCDKLTTKLTIQRWRRRSRVERWTPMTTCVIVYKLTLALLVAQLKIAAPRS